MTVISIRRSELLYFAATLSLPCPDEMNDPFHEMNDPFYPHCWNLGRYYLLDPKPGLADVALNSCRALCGTVSSRPVIQVKTQVKMVYKKLRIN